MAGGAGVFGPAAAGPQPSGAAGPARRDARGRRARSSSPPPLAVINLAAGDCAGWPPARRPLAAAAQAPCGLRRTGLRRMASSQASRAWVQDCGHIAVHGGHPCRGQGAAWSRPAWPGPVALATAARRAGRLALGPTARVRPVTGPAHAAASAADVRAAAVSRAAASALRVTPRTPHLAPPRPARLRLPAPRPPPPQPAHPPARPRRPGPPGDVREPGQSDHLGRRRAEPGAPAGPDRLETPARAQPDDHRPQALERPLGAGPARSGWPWPLPVRRLRRPLRCTRQRGHPGHPGRCDMKPGTGGSDVSIVDGSTLSDQRSCGSWRDRDVVRFPEGDGDRLAGGVGGGADRDDRALAGEVGGLPVRGDRDAEVGIDERLGFGSRSRTGSAGRPDWWLC